MASGASATANHSTLRQTVGSWQDAVSTGFRCRVEFCRSSFFKRKFDSKEDIDEYQNGFNKISMPLKTTKSITNKYEKELFLTGLPTSLVKWLAQHLLEENQKKENAPEIDMDITLLHDQFGKDSIKWNPWDEECQKSKRAQADSRSSGQ